MTSLAIVLGALCAMCALDSAAASVVKTVRAVASRDSDGDSFGPKVERQIWNNVNQGVKELVRTENDEIGVLDSVGNIRAYKVETGEEIQSLDVSSVGVRNPLAFSMDGKIALASYSFYDPDNLENVCLVSSLTGRNFFIFQARQAGRRIEEIALNPSQNHEFFVLVTYDASAEANSPLPTLRRTQVELYSYTLSSDGEVEEIWFSHALNLSDTFDSLTSLGGADNCHLQWSHTDTSVFYVTSLLSDSLWEMRVKFDGRNSQIEASPRRVTSVGAGSIIALMRVSFDGKRAAVLNLPAVDYSEIRMIMLADGSDIYRRNFSISGDGVVSCLGFHYNSELLYAGFGLRGIEPDRVDYPMLLSADGASAWGIELNGSESGSCSGVEFAAGKTTFVTASTREILFPVPSPPASNITIYDANAGGGGDDGGGDGGGDDGVCFPMDASVIVRGGASRRLDELAIGDEIADGSGGFSVVHTFGHREIGPTATMHTFVALHWGNNTQNSSGRAVALGVLHLSSNHLLYVDGSLKPARNVRVGEILRRQIVDGDGTMHTELVRIVAARQVRKLGLVNPHTMSGEILVEGIHVSCYTQTINSRIAHAMLAPLRAVYALTQLDALCGMLNSALPAWVYRTARSLRTLSL